MAVHDLTIPRGVFEPPSLLLELSNYIVVAAYIIVIIVLFRKRRQHACGTSLSFFSIISVFAAYIIDAFSMTPNNTLLKPSYSFVPATAATLVRICTM